MIGGNTFEAHARTHTDAGRHTKARAEVMGLQYYWSAKGETLKCHLCSWDAIYSLSLAHSRLCSLHYVMLSKHSD